LSSIFFQRNKHLLEELPELEVHFLLFMDYAKNASPRTGW
jgi:hypothetical protein